MKYSGPYLGQFLNWNILAKYGLKFGKLIMIET